MTKEIPRLIRLNVLAVDMDGGGLNPPPLHHTHTQAHDLYKILGFNELPSVSDM